MFLNAFHTQENNLVQISAEQGSRFAKEVSDDFNPLHNPENKRFIVPGDLLFALTLSRLGLAKKMTFNYTGMVARDSKLAFPESMSQEFAISDGADKDFLNVQTKGEATQNNALIETFIRAYVAFSGHSFPHILVPLMRDNNVMINPARPMVMYESMAFEFDTLEIDNASLELVNSELNVNGKRGQVKLEFAIFDGAKNKVGHGYKTMVLSGLREYDETAVSGLIDIYEDSKKAYAA